MKTQLRTPTFFRYAGFFFSLFALACTTTSTTTTETTRSEDGGGAEPERGETVASPIDDGENATDSGSPTISCEDSETKAACDQCCFAFNPEGQNYYQATSIAIMCRDTNCKKACAATYCASPPSNPDPACKECWNSVIPSHADEFFEICRADNDCAEFVACLDNSGCSTKLK